MQHAHLFRFTRIEKFYCFLFLFSFHYNQKLIYHNEILVMHISVIDRLLVILYLICLLNYLKSCNRFLKIDYTSE